MKKYLFHVIGMHCNSCVILTESELQEHKNVDQVIADLKTCCVEVQGDFGDKSEEDVARELSLLLEKHGYTLSLEKKENIIRWRDFTVAVPAAIGFIAFFVILQKIGIVNLISSDTVSYGTAFFIGFIASVSTCMAVVGGLVLSVSANFAKEGDTIKPQVLFHIGRLVSFFVLGGAIGAIGSAVQIGMAGTFVLGLIVGIVMLILGINLLDIFPWAKKLQPTMPKFISRHLFELKKINHTVTPILLGIITFFLPCGFTQSMQIYALSTGDFWTGAMVMFVFALGTFPILALLSFSSVGVHDKVRSSIFFKTAGLVVIFFGLFNVMNSLVAFGAIPPIYNF